MDIHNRYPNLVMKIIVVAVVLLWLLLLCLPAVH